MNALSVQSLGADPHAATRSRFYSLPPHLQKEVLSRAIDWGVMQGLEDCRRTGVGMGALSQAEQQQSVTSAISSALTPILGGTAKNLGQQAADVIGPVIEDKLKQYAPIFGVIAGLVAAVFSVIGMVVVGGYVVKKMR